MLKKYFAILMIVVVFGCQKQNQPEENIPLYCDDSDLVVMENDSYIPSPPDWIVIEMTTCTDLSDETIFTVEKKVLTFLIEQRTYIEDGFVCEQKSYMCHSETMERVDWTE